MRQLKPNPTCTLFSINSRPQLPLSSIFSTPAGLHKPTTIPTSPLHQKHYVRPIIRAPGALPDYKIARIPLEEAIATQSRFPWRDEFQLSRDISLDAEAIMETLSPLLTEERLTRIEKVCSQRTFDVLPIVEHPYDLGNLAAVLRSADAMGIGAVHVIRNMEDTRYKQSSRTSGGSEKWLDVQIHKSTSECLAQAKARGYQIVATHLRAGSIAPAEVDWTKPTAVVFGNELKGVSDEVLSSADECIAIPMDGFVESFNVSIAAALTLWEARRVRNEKLGFHANLTQEQIRIMKAVFVLRTRGLAKQWIAHMLSKPPPEWQQHRNKGNFFGKEFLPAEGGSSSSSSNQNKSLITPRQGVKCYLWDGECCYGEKLFFPHKECRYKAAHNKGINTLNINKLEEGFKRLELPMEEFEVLKAKLLEDSKRKREVERQQMAAVEEKEIEKELAIS